GGARARRGGGSQRGGGGGGGPGAARSLHALCRRRRGPAPRDDPSRPRDQPASVGDRSRPHPRRGLRHPAIAGAGAVRERRPGGGLEGRLHQRDAAGELRSEPVLGFLLGSSAFHSGDDVPLSRFVSVGLEVEVGFVMSSDLSGPGVTASTALLAVAGAIPCFELIDFRLSGKPRGADVVADGVYANAMVLGGSLTPVQG